MTLWPFSHGPAHMLDMRSSSLPCPNPWVGPDITGTIALSAFSTLFWNMERHMNKCFLQLGLRGAWSDRDTNDIFAHCSLIFPFLDFKFSNFVCPSELHPLIWFFCKNSFGKMKNIRKTTQNAFAPSIFIVLSIVLKLGTPLLHTQAQYTLLQNF